MRLLVGLTERRQEDWVRRKRASRKTGFEELRGPSSNEALSGRDSHRMSSGIGHSSTYSLFSLSDYTKMIAEVLIRRMAIFDMR